MQRAQEREMMMGVGMAAMMMTPLDRARKLFAPSNKPLAQLLSLHQKAFENQRAAEREAKQTGMQFEQTRGAYAHRASVAPVASLACITERPLQVKKHLGKLMVCKTVARGVSVIGLPTAVLSSTGEAFKAAFYIVVPPSCAVVDKALPKDIYMLIKEPLCL